MNVHEYQAKALLKEYGVPILRGKVANTALDAVKIAQEIGGALWAVKAQIHAGGRGKAGGVVMAKSVEEVDHAAEKLIGSYLVTHQTKAQGQKVNCVYIEAGCSIAQEFYLSLVVDRSQSRVAIVLSAMGGMNIEEVAAQTPEKITTLLIDPAVGFEAFQGRKAAATLGLSGSAASQLGNLLKALYKTFIDLDLTLIEVNPLILTQQGDLVVADAKMTFDDNSLFRHPEIEKLRDEAEEDAAELEAMRQGLSYVKLEGNIGCMVNGAGLAMATMDIIKLHGAEPANFLDVGGGATQEKVSTAFKLILADSHVKAILINIFGGIMHCDIIAEGIVAAAKEVSLTVPMVVRLQGTNQELGQKILDQSGLKVIFAKDLGEAAQKAVQSLKGAV